MRNVPRESLSTKAEFFSLVAIVRDPIFRLPEAGPDIQFLSRSKRRYRARGDVPYVSGVPKVPTFRQPFPRESNDPANSDVHLAEWIATRFSFASNYAGRECESQKKTPRVSSTWNWIDCLRRTLNHNGIGYLNCENKLRNTEIFLDEKRITKLSRDIVISVWRVQRDIVVHKC